MNLQLQREDWDFRARPSKGDDWTMGKSYNFLEETEVFKCWLYEFNRRHTEDNQLALAWREKAHNPSAFESILRHYYQTDPNGKLGFTPVIERYYTLWPEWPDKPFLSIGPSDRKARYKMMWEENSKRAIPMIPTSDIYRFVAALKSGGDFELLGIPQFSKRSVDLEPDSFIVKPLRDESAEKLPTEVIAFAIDYNLTDTQLLALFKSWLAKRRLEKTFYRQAQTGKSSLKTLRGQLNALGSQRLLAVGMTVDKALHHTQQVSGRALYADKHVWSKQRDIAEKAWENVAH